MKVVKVKVKVRISPQLQIDWEETTTVITPGVGSPFAAQGQKIIFCHNTVTGGGYLQYQRLYLFHP